MNSHDDDLADIPPTTEHGEVRPDLSSPHVREDVAMAGRCANVHLPTGRTCTRPARHGGSCAFVGPEDADHAAVS
ncbi:hypothetical protein QFZ79_001928 [Arthrobacter sp. V4I6]|nr:hypothetical protein [Arthrobacter sp. V1I7]MDQ0853817.1 hypothetical protein [Arthrobacter sp. V4I6]